MTVIINGTNGITSVNGTAAAPSVTGTDTDTGIVYGTNTLTLSTGGTAGLIQNASQNLGLKISAPSAWGRGNALEIGTNGTAFWGDLNNGNAAMSCNAYLSTTNLTTGWIYGISDSASLYQTGAGVHSFLSAASGTAGNPITWTQVIGVAKDKTLALQGNSSVTGAGITFPATQSASTDANTLDDYEEGSWTPTINLLGTLTYVVQSGRYVKVGKWVTIICQIAVSSTDTTQDTGSTLISGLPFTCSNTDPTGYSCVMTERVKGTNNSTAANTFFATAENNLTTVRLYANNYNGTFSQQSYFATMTRNFYIGGSAYFYFTASYIATA